MQELDDNGLLREYVERGSEDAFATLVERHVNKVYSVAVRHTGNPHQAEEITQAVFVILARKSRQLGAGVILYSWLYKTARLTSMAFIRGEIRRTRREQEAFMQNADETNESEVWRQIAPLLDAALAALNETDRRALVLRFFYGKSMREISADLGASEDSIRQRVNRALEKLQRYFLKRGVHSTTAMLAGAISTGSIQIAPAALAKTATAVALAKGATASTSTLTLIKGALKIMAWTKAKTAVIAVAAVLLAAGTTTVAIKVIPAIRRARLNAGHDIQGTWEGSLGGGMGVNKGESSRDRIVVRVSRKSGAFTATADLVDLGRKNVPMAIDYAYPSLRLSINPQVIFNGYVNTNGTQMTLNGLVLYRTNEPDAVAEALTEAEFAPRADSDLQGYWKGTIGTGPDALPVNWKIAQEDDGTFRAELDNPNQGANGQPATVVYGRPSVKLTLVSSNGMVQGEINSNNTEITGSWIEGGQAVPVSFSRADFEAEHAQEALKDYSFHSDNDLQGHWETRLPIKFPVILDLEIAKMPDGDFSATVASIYHYGHDGHRPASDFQFTAPDLRIAWKWMNDRFEGKLKDGKITGAWMNGNKKWPVVFERKRTAG